MVKNIILVGMLFLFASCNNQKNTNDSENSSNDNLSKGTNANISNTNFSGEYLCEFGPEDNGYLAYLITLEQKEGKLSGKLFAGIYASNSDIGYTMLLNSAESTLNGEVKNNETLLDVSTKLDTIIGDNEYPLPTFENVCFKNKSGSYQHWLKKPSRNGIYTIIYI